MITKFSEYFILSSNGISLFYYSFDSLKTNKNHNLYFFSLMDQKLKTNSIQLLSNSGFTFYYKKTKNLYFVLSSKNNQSINLGLFLLENSILMICNFLGAISEVNIKQNYFLILEVLDEIFTCGYFSDYSITHIKKNIKGKPINYHLPTNLEKIKDLAQTSTRSSSSSNRSIIRRYDNYTPLLDYNNLTQESIGNNNTTKNGFKSLTSNIKGIINSVDYFHFERKDEVYLDIKEKIDIQISKYNEVISKIIYGNLTAKCYLKEKRPFSLSFTPIYNKSNGYNIKNQRNSNFSGYCNDFEGLEVDYVNSGVFETVENYKNNNFKENIINKLHEGDFKIFLNEGINNIFDYTIIYPKKKGNFVENDVPIEIEIDRFDSDDDQYNIGFIISIKSNIPLDKEFEKLKISFKVPECKFIKDVNARFKNIAANYIYDFNSENFISSWIIHNIEFSKIYEGKFTISLDIPNCENWKIIKENIFENIGSIFCKFKINGYLNSGWSIKAFKTDLNDEFPSICHRWVRYQTLSCNYEKKIN